MNFNFNYQLPLILQFKINQQWALGTPHSISACSTFWFTQKDLKQQVCWKLFLMGKKKNSQFCLIDRICVRVSRSLKWTKKLSQKPKYISYWVAFCVHFQSVTAEIASPEGKLVFSANYWRGVITIFFFQIHANYCNYWMDYSLFVGTGNIFRTILLYPLHGWRSYCNILHNPTNHDRWFIHRERLFLNSAYSL